MTNSLFRVSAFGACFWESGKLIWDDVIGHRRFALAEGAESVLRWFRDWKTLASVADMTDDPSLRRRYEKVAALFAGSDILVEAQSPRHHLEESTGERWRHWGRMTSAYHLSTRNLTSQTFNSDEAYAVLLSENLEQGAAPPAHHTFPAAPAVALPDGSEARWVERDLLELLYRRRSERVYGEDPISLESAAALLRTSAGIVELHEPTQTVFKTSPSGGGRHPTEIYVYVRSVSGVEPGAYHYNPGKNVLERLGGARSDDELVRLTGDQPWTAGAGMFVFYTAVLERSMWKYRSGRTYRMLHVDVGHLNQTVYLLTAALGLATTFTAAVRDELVEELLGLDPVHELVMGCAVVGVKA